MQVRVSARSRMEAMDSKLLRENRPTSEAIPNLCPEQIAHSIRKQLMTTKNKETNQADIASDLSAASGSSPIVDCGIWCNPKCPHLNSDFEPDFWRCKLTPDSENLEDDGNPIASCC